MSAAVYTSATRDYPMKVFPSKVCTGAYACVALLVRVLFVVAFSLAVPAALSAQEVGSISGRVVNKGTGEYLRNAVVTVVSTGESTLSGPGGVYRLANVPAGPTRVSVVYTGLDPVEVTVVVTAGQAVLQDLSLTSGAYSEDLIELGEFAVTGAREGNARAIMEQRYAPNPKKVIAADAIGNVSEGNVGEFLKLMPGITMDYVEADTRSVRVRGLNPKYANVLLDGMQLASAGSSNIGTGRAYEFEQLSIASVETVELTKAPTPDQPSSVSGTVNLKTKGAFDRQGRRINFSTSLATNSYYASFSETEGWDNKERRKVLPNFSFEFSDVFADGKLGVIAGFSRNSTIAAQKHIWFWMDGFDADPSNNATEVPKINWIWLQDGPKPTERDNYQVRLDYRASDDLHLYARVGFNTYDARFYNRTLSLRPDRDGAGALLYAPGATQTDMTVTSGRISTDSNQFMTKEGDTLALSAGANYVKGNFTADLGVQYVRQKNWYNNLKYGHFTDFSSSINGVSWRMTRPTAGSTDVTFTQLAGPDWRDISNYSFDANSIAWHERRSEDEKATLRADFEHDLRNGNARHRIKYGAMTTNQDYWVQRYGALRTNPVGPDGVYGTADDPRPVNFLDPLFQSDWDFTANMRDWPALSPWLIYDHYRANPSHYVDATAANNNNRAQNNWFFKEKIHSVYLQDVMTFGKLEVAPGLRYEYTDSSGRGVNRTNNTFVTGGNTYGALLQYLHANYKLGENIVLRASYHTAITRADIANLVPGISAINDADRILTASNPDLREEESSTFNLSLEYYFEPVGQFTASIFRTRVKDLQLTSSIELGADGWGGNTEYAGWRLDSVANVGTPIVHNGFELDYSHQLAFLPGPLKGLGVFANYTYLDYDEWRFYLGSPKWMANGGVAYNQGPFGARLNVNKIGKILTWWNTPAHEYQKDRMQLDLNVEYRVNRSFTAFVDARNLTNEPSQSTYRGHENNFIRVLKTGTIWMVGVKGTF
jgi:TonB-dependent receptor